MNCLYRVFGLYCAQVIFASGASNMNLKLYKVVDGVAAFKLLHILYFGNVVHTMYMYAGRTCKRRHAPIVRTSGVFSALINCEQISILLNPA